MDHRIFQIRATGVLIEAEKILLVRQRASQQRRWSLPGGRLERGERLEEAVVREIWEETGLRTEVERLLYVADKPEDQLLHITFALKRKGGEIQMPTNELEDNPISAVEFVPLEGLEQYGFTARWRQRAQGGFVDAPAYVGLKVNIGL